MISSLVGSGHPDEYSYEVVPHEYLSNVTASLIWDFLFFLYFFWVDFPSCIFADFFRTTYFRRRYIFVKALLSWSFAIGEALFYSFLFGEATSSHYFRVTTSRRQWLFRSSYFFRAAAFYEELCFQKSHFLAPVIFSEYLIFRS